MTGWVEERDRWSYGSQECGLETFSGLNSAEKLQNVRVKKGLL